MIYVFSHAIAVWRMPRALQIFLILGLLEGCTVGPDFVAPRAPDVPMGPPLQPLAYPARPCTDPGIQDDRRYCINQSWASGRDIPGAWWTLFHSRPLSNLMERALWENHDLKAVQAALRAAHANYEAQRGALFPVVNANYLPTKQKVATRDIPSPTWSELPFYTLHTAQLTVSYVPDVFGGIRRQIEASAAQEDLQRFLTEATFLTLTSNIALAAIQEASLRKQIDVTNYVIHDEFLLRKSRLNKSAVDIASLEAGINQASQTLPPLNKQLTIQRDMLAALSGGFAGYGLPEVFELKEMRLPRDLPVSLPSQLVEQRPDVRAAEANLHAATAAVGVAIANRLPLFNLYGNIGQTSMQFKYLFNSNPQVLFWTLAANVTQTIFDGFTLEQRQHAAEAGWNQAAEQYQSVVVTAFQNVADALQAIVRDEQSARWAWAARNSAAKNRCLTLAVFVQWDGKGRPDLDVLPDPSDPQWKAKVEREFEQWWRRNCEMYAGPKPYFVKGKEADKSGSDVLNAEQLFLSAQLTLVQAEAARYSDVVGLFQALGGGWWNRFDTERPLPEPLRHATSGPRSGD
jgi:NodT family efflux transporter outer membrane factor (OMF) lipoprotein